jgi:hypothetical protein
VENFFLNFLNRTKEMSSALEKLRRGRKQIEELEAQVLAAPVDAQEMHAWAARELRLLSDSIRNSKMFEMKTSRPLADTSQRGSKIPEPQKPVPALHLPAPNGIEEILTAADKTAWLDDLNWRSSTRQAPVRVETPLELEDEVVEPSEARQVQVSTSLIDGVTHPATSRILKDESNILLTSNISSTLKSVSLDDDESVFRDLRTCSPDPHPDSSPDRKDPGISPNLQEPTMADMKVPETIPEESAACRAQRVLNEFVMAERQREANLRADLGKYAQTKLALFTARGDAAKDAPPEIAVDEPPPLARIEKQTKNGVAFSFDFR